VNFHRVIGFYAQPIQCRVFFETYMGFVQNLLIGFYTKQSFNVFLEKPKMGSVLWTRKKPFENPTKNLYFFLC